MSLQDHELLHNPSDHREQTTVNRAVARIRSTTADLRLAALPPCDSEVRLFRNRNDVFFAGRACESVRGSIATAGGHMVDSDVGIHRVFDEADSHSAYRSPRKLLRLLHLDLADSSNRMDALFNLGRHHFRSGNFFNAECYLNDYLQQSSPCDLH